MMTLEEKIMADLKQAMREKDQEKLTALRAVKSAILMARTEKGKAHELTPQDEISILQKLVKQRNESAGIFKSQNRTDLYEKEMAEVKVISAYLPEQVSEEALKAILTQIIKDTGATSMRDMGKVMQIAVKELAGKADGSTVSAMVKALLS